MVRQTETQSNRILLSELMIDTRREIESTRQPWLDREETLGFYDGRCDEADGDEVYYIKPSPLSILFLDSLFCPLYLPAGHRSPILTSFTAAAAAAAVTSVSCPCKPHNNFPDLPFLYISISPSFYVYPSYSEKPHVS
ncbi:hypothetical protein L1987_79842 [Smallanthus sonchifolius]|uniref:Uncharacterized protein n=1 Tax=Smallanthus sonchifolius TaxID=185202 RepID=A0ACB8YMI0_9ASTR|nr:hypothetical protein L1987_79842 [Smallanthus sonchifolius]